MTAPRPLSGLRVLEVATGATTFLRYCKNEDEARAWCDRWAEILLREGDR